LSVLADSAPVASATLTIREESPSEVPADSFVPFSPNLFSLVPKALFKRSNARVFDSCANLVFFYTESK
jgi:hypothetical protein